MFRLFRRSRRARAGDDGTTRARDGTMRPGPDAPDASAAAGDAHGGAGNASSGAAAAPADAAHDTRPHDTPGATAGTHADIAAAPGSAHREPDDRPPPGASKPPDSPPPPAAPPPPPGSSRGADHPPPRGIALDEIARGMQHAAAAANQLLAHQYTAVLDQFFDRRDDGLLAPREVTVALDAEHAMPVPLVALATPRGLALERMVVHLTVRGDFTEALPAGGIAGDDQRGRFYVTFAPRSGSKDTQGVARQRDTEHIDIEMQFAALAPPEAIMRVIDEYTQRLVPRARPGSKENDDGEPA
ncbi:MULTISPECIES: DUF2589 domain-containing protein [Burkholderia]|uniref:DUF2589 domain-containing protein n=2 Tax=Burkholderia TaxID=32008 RepID=UPI000A44E747|nr:MULTISPECIES: DUF2589 domain-containing protein [Burkholderia]MCC5028118.1 DUF2589 domain-containing protein [Burkholderia dolosa]UEB51906.1 DUF2589 domain-containing protein [Burkholderia dolosa]UEC12658.1 DUF2589 domain-containing protein [Burkholderia dolosa]